MLDGWLGSISQSSCLSQARHCLSQHSTEYSECAWEKHSSRGSSSSSRLLTSDAYLHDLDGRYCVLTPPRAPFPILFPPVHSPAATSPLPSPLPPNDGIADAAAPDMKMQLNRLDSLPSLPPCDVCALQPPCSAGAYARACTAVPFEASPADGTAGDAAKRGFLDRPGPNSATPHLVIGRFCPCRSVCRCGRCS